MKTLLFQRAFRSVSYRMLLSAAALAWAACVRQPPGAPAPDARPRVVKAAAVGPQKRMISQSRKCMGTLCQIKAYHLDEALVTKAMAAGMAEMDRLEALMTSWTDTSDVAKVNTAAGKSFVVVAPETFEVIQKGLWCAEKTAGAFDITVGVFKGLWKFDQDNDGSIPDPKEVKKRLLLVNWKDVLIDPAKSSVKLRRVGQRLNLEGLAKGYAVDAAVKAMRAAGLNDFIFQAGGDLFASGRPGNRDWRVGVQDPRGTRGKTIYELSISNQAFNTSGDYERTVVRDNIRYHHILDARTGFPAKGTRSVTLLAKDAFTADTLDTALFAVGPAAAMKLIEELPEVEGVIITADNEVQISSGLKERLIKRGDPSPGI